jgi:hypothetical protein
VEIAHGITPCASGIAISIVKRPKMTAFHRGTVALFAINTAQAMISTAIPPRIEYANALGMTEIVLVGR